MNRQIASPQKSPGKAAFAPSQLENSESRYSKFSGFLRGLPEMVGAMSPASCELSCADCYGWKLYVSPL